MTGASFPDPRPFNMVKEEKVDADLDIRMQDYLSNEQKNAYEDQKTAYKSEIKRFEDQISKNEAEIMELNRNLHNLEITTFSKKLELLYGATLGSAVISFFPVILVVFGYANIMPIVYGATFGASMLISNSFLLRRFYKNKKNLKEELNISTEEEIQDKRIELELKKEVLEQRNEIYNTIVEKLEIEYDELCESGIPREIEQKVFNEEEVNTNNVRGTRMIKNSIYTLEAEQEKHFREMDKMNMISSIKNIRSNSKIILGFDDIFEYGFSPFFILALMLILGIQLEFPFSPWLLLLPIGAGTLFSSLKLHSINNRFKAIKRKFKELCIKKYRYKELEERKELERKSQIEYAIYSREKELINENIELKYSERKKQEFEYSHRELYREETIEQVEEKPMVLKME